MAPKRTSPDDQGSANKRAKTKPTKATTKKDDSSKTQCTATKKDNKQCGNKVANWNPDDGPALCHIHKKKGDDDTEKDDPNKKQCIGVNKNLKQCAYKVNISDGRPPLCKRHAKEAAEKEAAEKDDSSTEDALHLEPEDQLAVKEGGDHCAEFIRQLEALRNDDSMRSRLAELDKNPAAQHEFNDDLDAQATEKFIDIAIASVTAAITRVQSLRGGFSFVMGAASPPKDATVVRPSHPLLFPISIRHEGREQFVLFCLQKEVDGTCYIGFVNPGEQTLREGDTEVGDEIQRVCVEARDFAQESNWMERFAAKDKEKMERTATDAVWIHADQQHDAWQNRYFVILHAWAMAMGLIIQTAPKAARPDEFFIIAHELIKLARCGGLNWKIIYDFLKCHDLIKSDQSYAIVPLSRRFANTVRFIDDRSLQTYLKRLQQEDLNNWVGAGQYDKYEIGMPSSILQPLQDGEEPDSDDSDDDGQGNGDGSDDDGQDNGDESDDNGQNNVDEDEITEHSSSNDESVDSKSGQKKAGKSTSNTRGSGKTQIDKTQAAPLSKAEECLQVLCAANDLSFEEAFQTLRDYLDKDENGMTHDKFPTMCEYANTRLRLFGKLYDAKSRKLPEKHDLHLPAVGDYWSSQQVVDAIMAVVIAIDRLQASGSSPFHGGFSLFPEASIQSALSLDTNDYPFGIGLAHPRRCFLLPVVIDSHLMNNFNQYLEETNKGYQLGGRQGGHTLLIVLQEEDRDIQGEESSKTKARETEFRTYILDSADYISQHALPFLHERATKAARKMGWTGTRSADAAIPFASELAVVDVLQQHENWTCGLHTIWNAWIIALGLTPQLDGEVPEKTHEGFPMLVSLAFEGALDWRTITAWLICKGLVQETSLEAVPTNRRFLETQLSDGEPVEGAMQECIDAIFASDDWQFGNGNIDDAHITIDRSNNYDFSRLRNLQRGYEESMNLEYDTYAYPDDLDFLSNY